MKNFIERSSVIGESEIPDFREVLDAGKKLAKEWYVTPNQFLNYHNVTCESEYKRKVIHSGRVMQHAHMGFRDKQKSIRALTEIYDKSQKRGVCVDRFGICLDWSMGYSAELRDKKMKGTGLILNTAEDFLEITNAVPSACHFGDFMLGFPAALENTCYALAAGATTIGNLGQYFTFRLPDENDDLAATESTLMALALAASQPVDVLIHSNLDDGFAAVFQDISCALGAAMLEQYIVEDLIGGKITHCFGHHYSSPVLRLGFQDALSKISHQPGSMIYGNTVLYRGSESENFASLSSYLMLDIVAQINNPSGHAVNPVPVTENLRIPDIDEIVDAQLFAGQLANTARDYAEMINPDYYRQTADTLTDLGKVFFENVLNGFEAGGIDISNPFEMLLAIRRIGGKKLEQLYGVGELQSEHQKRKPVVVSDTVIEIEKLVDSQLQLIKNDDVDSIVGSGLKILVASTDVHEHSKMMLEGIFEGLGLTVLDGGESAQPDQLAKVVEDQSLDAVALTTYNGVALTFFGQLKDELVERGLETPVFIGGQLNEIDDDDPESLPRDVIPELEKQGAIVCCAVVDMIPALKSMVANRGH